METRRCRLCQQIKTIDNFRSLGRYGKTRRYWNSYCNPCELKRNVEYRKKHPEWFARQQRTMRQRWIIKATGGKCAICEETRVIDIAHIIPRKGRKMSRSDSLDNLLGLCPTHHRLFDEDSLSEEEYSKIESQVEKARELYG